MTTLFLTFLNMTVTAGLAILAVLAARLLLRPAPRIFSYVLWAAVLFRLLCPVSLSVGVSLPAPLDPSVSREGRLTYFAAPEVPAFEAAADTVFSPATEAAEESAPSLLDWAARLWLTGAAALALWGGLRLLLLRRRLREALSLGGRVYQTDAVSTPFVLGLLRPRIYLPAGLPEEESAYILCHKRCHIRRGDHLFRLLAYAALCLHWYNPLVWLAFFLSVRDMELSCDEAVLRRMGRDIRGDYASSLLRLSAAGPSPFSPAFGEGDTALRIRRLMTGRPLPRWALALSLAGAAVLLTLLVVNPRSCRSDFHRWTSTLTADDLTPAEAQSAARFYAGGPRYPLRREDLETVTALFRALDPDDVRLSPQPGEPAEYRLNLFPSAGGNFIFLYDPGRPGTLSLLCDTETAAAYDFDEADRTVTLHSPDLAAFLLERLPPDGLLEAAWPSRGETAVLTDGETIAQVLLLLARGERPLLPDLLPSSKEEAVTVTLSTASGASMYVYRYTLTPRGDRWQLELADGERYLLSQEDAEALLSLLGLSAH